MATAVNLPTSVELFYSYAHCDEPLCKELQKHLRALKRSGLIRDWYDRKIEPGSEWAAEIHAALERAGIILLLVSADFLASQYIFEVELPFAMQRQSEGRARVIPILLRPVEWHDLPFAKLQVLPTSARPVTSWPSPDEAFCDVAARLRELLYSERLEAAKSPAQPAPAQTSTQERVLDAAIASSVVIDEPTDVVTMFRTTESGGLKAILQLDRTYTPTAEDVKSNTVEIDFPRDPSGKLLPTSVTLLLEAPGFDPPSETKPVRIPASGDSPVFVFMLTPKRAGMLRPNLRIIVNGTEIGSRLLITKAVPAEAAQPAMAYNVISWPVPSSSSERLPTVAPAPAARVAPTRFPEQYASSSQPSASGRRPPSSPPGAALPSVQQRTPGRSKRNVWIAVGSSAAAIAIVATLTTQFNPTGSPSPASSPPRTASAPPTASAPAPPTASAPAPAAPRPPLHPPTAVYRPSVESVSQLRKRFESDQDQIKSRGQNPNTPRAKQLIEGIAANLEHAETALSSHKPDQAQRYVHSAQIDLAELESTFDLR